MSSKAQQSAQTPAERRKAEAELRALVARQAPKHQRLVAGIRRSLRKLMPTAFEIVYEYRDSVVCSFSPSDRGYEGVLAVHASDEGVKLCFNRGTELSDPDKLLGGSGKLVRSMDVTSTTVLTRASVAKLIQESLTLNPVPFSKSGKGDLVIRETTAKKRTKRRAK